MNGAQQLHPVGQSLWLDAITRRLFASGAIVCCIKEFALTWITWNLNILGHAISASGDSTSRCAIVWPAASRSRSISSSSARWRTCGRPDPFRPLSEATEAVDRWVCLKVPSALAHDAAATVGADQAVAHRGGRPNVFIMVPGTTPGLAAFEKLIVAGVPVNVTLLFSDVPYLAPSRRTWLRRTADSA